MRDVVLSELSIHEVIKLLPHRYPIILVDKVLEVIPGESIRAIKNVTINEPVFQGHFPGYPVFPGVLICEAMAQAAAVLAFKTAGIVPSDDNLYLFAGIDNARFKRQVLPGDQMVMDIKIDRQKRSIWKFKAQTSVDGQLACVADLTVAQTTT